ncbi:hypothetical protein GCM10027034_23400 [Ramlibacter solisilvae]|uniref:Membrane protein n=1 Tax=Ramlibacter tataouinensis TaxID=94132 RepID=A0A127JPZ3_9BURK|nr:hypothetical protein [Ramlibacter tataouinensis]AMO22050.1 membrane protein [Ramlibacter tataouinensis]
MSIFSSPRFLRNVLLADAASCLATGAAQTLLGEPLAELLRLPPALLSGTGLFLLAYALVVGLVATREPVSRPMVGLFIAGNFAWGAACIALLAGSWVMPGALGQAWVAAQAATVLVLGELQWLGLRRATPAGWA